MNLVFAFSWSIFYHFKLSQERVSEFYTRMSNDFCFFIFISFDQTWSFFSLCSRTLSDSIHLMMFSFLSFCVVYIEIL